MSGYVCVCVCATAPIDWFEGGGVAWGVVMLIIVLFSADQHLSPRHLRQPPAHCFPGGPEEGEGGAWRRRTEVGGVAPTRDERAALANTQGSDI